MTRATVIALALACCTMQTHDAPRFEGVAELVPDPFVEQAVAEVEACLGYSCDLTDWAVFYAAGESSVDMRFACPDVTECGPRPPGCTCDAMCPCRCSGLTLGDEMQVIVAKDLRSLKHELIHVCAGVLTHSGPGWACEGPLVLAEGE